MPSAPLPSPKPSNLHIMPSSPSTELAANAKNPAAIDSPSSTSPHSLTVDQLAQTIPTTMTPNNPLGLLGKLPRELRDMIYAYAVDPPTKDDFAGEADDYYRDITRRRPIMQTCKQIRLECMESYLSENEIECDIGPPCWYGFVTSLSNILARPYFRAQGNSMYVECFRQGPFDMEITQQRCQTMQTYLRLYRSIPQIGFSIPTKNLFLQLDYNLPSYVFDDVSAQWRVISPDSNKISIKLWVNDRRKSVAEIGKVCSRLKDTVLRHCQQSTCGDPSAASTSESGSQTHTRVSSWEGELREYVLRISDILALITGLEKYNVAVVETMMHWWQDEDAKDKKAKQELEIEQKKRKQELEDVMQDIRTEFSKLVEAIKSTPKRNIQETEGMVETQERSPKRRNFD
ncbi:hypothetical protein D6C76_09909 [Aureobasidium pullulans]|nr:hypothetical protein D6C76_09909 [Aureobasidium pullulans]